MDSIELPAGFCFETERGLIFLRADGTRSKWARTNYARHENLATFYPREGRLSVWSRAETSWDSQSWTGTEEEAKQYMINALYLGMLQIGPEGEPETEDA